MLITSHCKRLDTVAHRITFCSVQVQYSIWCDQVWSQDLEDYQSRLYIDFVNIELMGCEQHTVSLFSPLWAVVLKFKQFLGKGERVWLKLEWGDTGHHQQTLFFLVVWHCLKVFHLFDSILPRLVCASSCWSLTSLSAKLASCSISWSLEICCCQFHVLCQLYLRIFIHSNKSCRPHHDMSRS